MKRAILFLTSLYFGASLAHAHSQPPITVYVQDSKTVCIVKVTAIENNTVTFKVEEVVKGNPPAFLKLVPMDETYPMDSEWLLAATGAKENTVGWAMDGDFGWVNSRIKRVGGKVFFVDHVWPHNPGAITDPSKGLTLEDLKKAAATPLPRY